MSDAAAAGSPMDAFLRSIGVKNKELSEGGDDDNGGQKKVDVVLENNETTQQIDSSDEYDSTQDTHGVQTTGQTAQHHSSSSLLDSPDTVATDSRPNSTSALARNTTLISPSLAFPTLPNNNTSDQVTAQESLLPSQVKMPVQAPMSARGSIPGSQKVRLPNDLIGILEDRIKEDSKGDVDAWLGLIDEYKRRGKSNDVRSVYKRFLKAFPLAVSWVRGCQSRNASNDSLRQNNGRRLSNLRTKQATDKE